MKDNHRNSDSISKIEGFILVEKKEVLHNLGYDYYQGYLYKAAVFIK